MALDRLIHRPLVQLTLARLRAFYREPAAVFWVYGFPLALALALGIAFEDRPVTVIHIDVIARGNSTEQAEALRDRLAVDNRIVVTISDPDSAKQRLRTAKTDLLIGWMRSSDNLEYTSDPTRPECALARATAENTLRRDPQNAGGRPRDSFLTEPGSRYIDFLMPGLIGANLMGGGLWGVGFVTVDMRVRKLLKRFVATPMRRSDFLLALMLSRLIFTLIEIALLLIFSYLVFGVKVQGNVLALAVLIAAGGACFAGIGLLVACRVKTIESVSGLMNLVMIPMYVTSGVFFPASKFPAAIQPILQLLPLTVLNDGLRAIINDGAGFDALGFPLLVLGTWGGICFALALRFFRWT